MYVKIRKISALSSENDTVVNVSKTCLIQDLRRKIFANVGIEVNKQRLFYKGKQLMDDYRIVDYNIQLNDVIQLMSHNENAEESTASNNKNNNEATTKHTENKCETVNVTSNESGTTNAEINLACTSSITKDVIEIATSKYFRIEDKIDVIDIEYGAWFEARIMNIFKYKTNAEQELIYRIKMETDVTDITLDVHMCDIRPRSYRKLNRSDLKEGQMVMVNYNIETPSTRGYWYDFKIEKINSKFLKGTIFVGKDRTKLENCKIKYIDEILQIEKVTPLNSRTEDSETINSMPLRKTVYYCEKCKDVSSKPCRECGCKICSGKSDSPTIVLCDECDYGYHIKCLTPPLESIPSDPEWYCPSCKNDENEIVKAGEKLKHSTKRAKMMSTKSENLLRDWGRGMACVGRTKECTIVPKHHYGPIPGVEVGTLWKFRLQVSEAGIHRPHVAGIHGRETDGAYSLILSGGYADDIDTGNEFVYSGSGGRDLSGNKRISDQSCDQTLTRMNKALALNCNVQLNEQGGEATDWRGGKPVRVVRNYKLAKHSKYAPKDGNRYDGIYKIVKYYPEKNKEGFIVWKYVLRRDDSEPAPWEAQGRELDMIYPPGFLEAQALKVKESKNKQQKRRASDKQDDANCKKQKCEPFKLQEKLAKLIAADQVNKKLWDECKSFLSTGRRAFLSKVEEIFMCVCCQEIIYNPVTTECNHNICKGCLKRSFSSEIYSCPNCRFEFDKTYVMKVNTNLSEVLLQLFPGYHINR